MKISVLACGRVFGKLVVLGCLILANLSLLMWLMAQTRLTEAAPLGSPLHDSVRAVPSALEPPAPRASHPLASPLPATEPTPSQPALMPPPAHKETRAIRRLVLYFDKSAVNLSEIQQQQLEQSLRDLNIGHASQVRILAGPAFSENNMLTTQTEKLRAQAVARAIFPYTRAVSIGLQQSSVEHGEVAIEFVRQAAAQGS